MRTRFTIAGFAALSATAALTASTAVHASSVEWHVTAPTNWTGDGQQPVAFLNVAADADGHIYVANFSSALIYDAQTGALQGAIKDQSGTVIQYDDVAPAGDGNVWVADSKSFNVYLLDPAGTVLRTIPYSTVDPADSLHPNELEIGPDGNLYVMYSSMSTVMQVFAPDGTFNRSFSLGSVLSTGLIDFTFGPDGNVYVAGSMTARVLDPEGTVVTDRFAPDFLDASTGGVHGIAVDASGNVYIGGNALADDGSLVAAVYQFDANGQLLTQFGHAQQRINWGEAFQPEELAFTVTLAALPDGRLVISDLNGAYSQLLAVTMA